MAFVCLGLSVKPLSWQFIRIGGPMSQSLVVVESPHKAKTIQKYLGPDYVVLPTVGHFRDLPERDLGIDLATMAPTYVVDEDKRAVLAAIRKAAKTASTVYLASDADREGEAIAWHLREELALKSAKRMRATEITPSALQAALAAAGALDEALVDAQQMRRCLDRLVGYQLSPELRPFGPNHSAGRVQTAALHLIVTRELAREAHVPVPYWSLTARYAKGFSAKYHPSKTPAPDAADGPPEEARIHSEAEAAAILERARGPHVVAGVHEAPSPRRPKPPFTTSTLQQAAARLLKLAADETMGLAQRLFEGGHISYHRSDSVAVSDDASRMAREWLLRTYPAAVPEVAPVYRQKSTAQGAHECIRPTSLDVGATATLQGQELELYELIRARFVASQCQPAVYATTTITIRSGDTTWEAGGSVVTFDSYLNPKIAGDVAEEADKTEEATPNLPAVAVGETLDLAGLDSKRRETTAPPRYTKASLVKAIDSADIGRPSTTAATIATLLRRDYIALAKEDYVATPRGRLIDGVLSAAFPALVEASYTANLEALLDEVAEGRKSGRAELLRWYGPWTAELAAAKPLLAAEAAKHPEFAKDASATPQPTGKSCPLCGKELLLRQGKNGPFHVCSARPACHYTGDTSARPSDAKCPKCTGPMEAVDGPKGPYARCLRRCEGGVLDLRPRKASDKLCPKCNGPMSEREGKYGPFARCDKPGCDGLVDLRPPAAEPCPVCGGAMRDKGDFLSCASYPTCKGTWDKQGLAAAKKANKHCPKCKTRLLATRKTPSGSFVGCSGYPACDYREPRPAAAPLKKAGGRR
jgi:DNA topoisomerase I